MILFKFDPSQLAVGQSVATLPDLSGNGYDLAESATAKQPVTADVDGKTCIKFSGGQSLSRAAVDFSGLTEIAVTVACRYFGTSLACLLEHGTSPLSSGGWGVYANNTRPTLGGGLGNGASSYRFFNASPLDLLGKPVCLTLLFKPGVSTPIDIRVNGQETGEVNAASAGTPTTALFKSLNLYMGARAGASIFANAGIFAVVASDSAADIEQNEAWAMSMLPPIPAPVANQRAIDIPADSFASVSYQTEATVLEFDAECSISSVYPSFAQIGLKVDSAHYASIPLSGGLNTKQVALPPGLKTVTITQGPQSKPSSTVLGSFLRAARANAPLITPEAGGLLIYGDSIAAGDAAANVQQSAWAMRVRSGLPYPVAVDAYGYRALHDDCATDAGIAAFVDKVAGLAPSAIWLAIGTNDCALAKWSAAVFGVAYGKLLDAMRAQMPWITVYAQSPTIRTNYVAEVAVFRAQIAAACSGRPWATYVNGLDILDAGDLADNVHPSTAGHEKYGQHVISIIQDL